MKIGTADMELEKKSGKLFSVAGIALLYRRNGGNDFDSLLKKRERL